MPGAGLLYVCPFCCFAALRVQLSFIVLAGRMTSIVFLQLVYAFRLAIACRCIGDAKTWLVLSFLCLVHPERAQLALPSQPASPSQPHLPAPRAPIHQTRWQGPWRLTIVPALGGGGSQKIAVLGTDFLTTTPTSAKEASALAAGSGLPASLGKNSLPDSMAGGLWAGALAGAWVGILGSIWMISG